MASLTLKGQVIHEDLEGGVWIFAADNGNRYQIQGGGKDLYKNGQKATVVGEIDTGAMSIAMIGEILQVKSYTLG
jgi:hypothetical protein